MDKKDPKEKLFKMETVLIVSFITLVVGFIGGVVFSGFRLGNVIPAASGSGMPSTVETSDQTMTDDQKAAIADLEKASQNSPEDVSVWISLGNAYFDGDLPEKAIPAYETALKIQPDNADVWTDLGVMYRKKENTEKAIEAFDKAQTVDPTHEKSLYNKGIVQMHDLNDPKAAVETWSKLLQINPSAKTQNGMMVKDLVEKLTAQEKSSQK